MKKIIVTVAFFASATAFAQKFELGAKAGTNISNFTGTDGWQNVKTKALVGYHFGGFISFFVGNNFAIQPELLFSSQGAKFESAGQTTNQKVSYINVPVLLKYTPLQSNIVPSQTRHPKTIRPSLRTALSGFAKRGCCALPLSCGSVYL